MLLSKKIECWLCDRLSEGSTWAAFAAIIGTSGTQLENPHKTYAILAGAMCGAVGVILREKKRESFGTDRKGNFVSKRQLAAGSGRDNLSSSSVSGVEPKRSQGRSGQGLRIKAMARGGEKRSTKKL